MSNLFVFRFQKFFLNDPLRREKEKLLYRKSPYFKSRIKDDRVLRMHSFCFKYFAEKISLYLTCFIFLFCYTIFYLVTFHSLPALYFNCINFLCLTLFFPSCYAGCFSFTYGMQINTGEKRKTTKRENVDDSSKQYP